MDDVFNAEDVVERPDVFRRLVPPALLGVFGDPVGHSLSPEFQNAGLKAAGIEGQYVRIQATGGQFEPAVRGLAAAGFIGANVTIPHKAAALAMVDEADEAARRAGGVNTLLIEGGRLLGFSTDGMGLSRAIQEEFSVDLKDLRVLVLGAGGGAGRAAAVQCAVEGCERVVLANRTFEKAAALASELAPMLKSDRLLGPDDRMVAVPMSPERLRVEIARVDLVINATSVGLRRMDPSPLPAELLTPNLLVYDMVYSALGTRLVREARAAGARASGGLSMLLHQGILAFEIWFGRPAPVEAMREALRKAAGG